MIRFTIPGEPCAKGRPRFTKAGRAYTPKNTENYENLVKYAYMASGNGLCYGKGVAVILTATAYFRIPAGASKKTQQAMREGRIRPTKRPDADNIAKTIADALNGLAYADDAQAVDMDAHKWYADEPRVEVVIREAL